MFLLLKKYVYWIVGIILIIFFVLSFFLTKYRNISSKITQIQIDQKTMYDALANHKQALELFQKMLINHKENIERLNKLYGRKNN